MVFCFWARVTPSAGRGIRADPPPESRTITRSSTPTPFRRESIRRAPAIPEMNTVRKHLSRIKGGQLARLIAPARVLTLILSDVPGNALDTIASGPVSPDSTTYREAVEILRRYRLWQDLPGAVRRHLIRGHRGAIPETSKPGDPVFEKVQHVIIGDNRVALRSAAAVARALGMRTRVLTGCLKGEAREVAQVFTSMARELHRGRKRSAPICLLASGETTVTVRGKGLGGRCQEFALSAALGISGLPRTVAAAFGTDGADGPTDAAGAYVGENTVSRARAYGLDPMKALQDNDSFSFFKALGQHIRTGPTRTNVNDLYLLIAY